MFAAVIKILTRSHCVNLPPARYRSDNCTLLRYLGDFLIESSHCKDCYLASYIILRYREATGGKGLRCALLPATVLGTTALQRCRLSPILKADHISISLCSPTFSFIFKPESYSLPSPEYYRSSKHGRYPCHRDYSTLSNRGPIFSYFRSPSSMLQPRWWNPERS